jgi:hypothetical protein
MSLPSFTRALSPAAVAIANAVVLPDNGGYETNNPRAMALGKKVIGSKWVFKVKRNADGSIKCYKGTVVAKGYNQHPGFDYIEIFAPTVRMPTI